jgi:hypothetical protein
MGRQLVQSGGCGTVPADDNERTRHVVEAVAAVAARGGPVGVFEHALLVGEPEHVLEAWRVEVHRRCHRPARRARQQRSRRRRLTV